MGEKLLQIESDVAYQFERYLEQVEKDKNHLTEQLYLATSQKLFQLNNGSIEEDKIIEANNRINYLVGQIDRLTDDVQYINELKQAVFSRIK